MSESSYQQLSALLPAGCGRENVTLAPYTTMRTGGPAALFAEPRNAQQLTHVHQWAQEKGLSLLILGNGSNLLIADSGFDGLVIHLGRALSEVSVFANTLTAQAGASLAARRARRCTGQSDRSGICRGHPRLHRRRGVHERRRLRRRNRTGDRLRPRTYARRRAHGKQG